MRTTSFVTASGQRLRITLGKIETAPADVIIVPTNTAIAVSGAAADVLIALKLWLEQHLPVDAELHSDAMYQALFPSLKLENPIDLRPRQLVIDLEHRRPVGNRGSAILSRELQEISVNVEFGWRRVILALIRHQGDDDAYLERFVTLSFLNACSGCERVGAKNVACVPFGTGFLGMRAERAGELLGSVFLQYLNLRPHTTIQTLTVVTDIERQLELFIRVVSRCEGLAKSG